MFLLLIAFVFSEGQIEKIDKRCDALNTTTIHLTGELKDLIKRVNHLNHSVIFLHEQIDFQATKITFLHQRINDLQNKINYLNEDLKNITIAFIFIDGIILFMIYLILHAISR